MLRPRRECDLTLAKETGNGGEWHLLDTPHSTHASCSSFLSFCNFCLSHFFNSLSAGGEWHLPDTAHSIHACSASISCTQIRFPKSLPGRWWLPKISWGTMTTFTHAFKFYKKRAAGGVNSASFRVRWWTSHLHFFHVILHLHTSTLMHFAYSKDPL